MKGLITVSILLIIYGLWWLFGPLCKTYINMKSHNIMTEDTYELNEVYHPYIEKITFVDGHFILFMTKPWLFDAGYKYIYISNNGVNWEVTEKSIRGGGRVGQGWNRVHDIPFEFDGKCFIDIALLGAQVSYNCKSNWSYYKFIVSDGYEVTHIYNFLDNQGNYYQPLRYKRQLVQVYKNNEDDIRTSQLIPGYAILYATKDGINWYKLQSSESVIQGLIQENNLQKAPLIEDIDYPANRMPPAAYDLPQFPQNNIKAYQVLSALNESHHLGLELKEELSAYGNGVYISVVPIRDKNDYHLFVSKDGVNYQLVKMPRNVVGFLTDVFFK